MPDPMDAVVPDIDERLEDDREDESNDLVYLKYMFEGARSLVELSAALRSLADHFDIRHDEGWRLVAPVDGGHAHLVREEAS